MKSLNSLLIRARKKKPPLRFAMGMIYESHDQRGKWVARGDLWNGKKGVGEQRKSGTYICDSVDDAMEALDELAEQYPPNGKVPIIIDNMMEMDGD